MINLLKTLSIVHGKDLNNRLLILILKADLQKWVTKIKLNLEDKMREYLVMDIGWDLWQIILVILVNEKIGTLFLD